MTMTTHKLAKMLLAAKDEPIYIKESYEVQGEYGHGYSNILGLDATSLENGYLFKVDYLSAEPNDKYYKIGEAESYLGYDEGKVNLSADDVIYMLFCNSYYKKYHNTFGDISFYEVEDDYFISYLEHTINVVVKDGFHPEWKSMSLNEAKVWYEENFSEVVNDYK